MTTEAWEASIAADLKGADYEKKLVWRSPEGIAVRPYYRAGAAAAGGAVRTASGWADGEALPDDAEAIDAAAWRERGADHAQELGIALSMGAARLAGGGEARGLRFVFGLGTQYLFEIAKLRAARHSWAQVLRAFGAPEAGMVIRGRTGLWNASATDPYTNLLRATVGALAGAVGGCDELTVTPAGFDAELARGVERVLREEARLDQVADAAAGAYALEALTDELGRKAWAVFQQLEAAGGWPAAEGVASELVAASRAAQEQAFATRRTVLVGVNHYPDPAPRTAVELAGAVWRLAAPMEALRRRVAAVGRPVRVQLLLGADRKMRAARAEFCAGFFGCAGLVCETGEAVDAGADAIVLCGADAEYVEMAGCVAGAAAPVYVAGRPAELPGVAGFVYLGCDQLAAIAALLDRLGVPHV